MPEPKLIELATSARRRSCPLRMPRGWQPPVPAYAARFDGWTCAGVAYVGIQSRGADLNAEAGVLQRLLSRNGAAHLERARFVDAAGYRNEVFLCYWTDPDRFRDLLESPGFSAWWRHPDRERGDLGYWIEFFAVPLQRLETLFSADDSPVGLSTHAEELIGPVREHAYAGAMRDRVPVSARDPLDAAQTEVAVVRKQETLGQRVRLQPPANLCVIRSGQDPTRCRGREQAIYTQDVYPVLLEGMDYLCRHAAETGCLSCRFMQEADMEGETTPRTFGLAYFLSMGHLEGWAASHPTHLAIYEAFFEMVGQIGEADMKLRLWHEVFAIPEDERHYVEYVSCHGGTGLLPFIA